MEHLSKHKTTIPQEHTRLIPSSDDKDALPFDPLCMIWGPFRTEATQNQPEYPIPRPLTYEECAVNVLSQQKDHRNTAIVFLALGGVPYIVHPPGSAVGPLRVLGAPVGLDVLVSVGRDRMRSLNSSKFSTMLSTIFYFIYYHAFELTCTLRPYLPSSWCSVGTLCSLVPSSPSCCFQMASRYCVSRRCWYYDYYDSDYYDCYPCV